LEGREAAFAFSAPSEPFHPGGLDFFVSFFYQEKKKIETYINKVTLNSTSNKKISNKNINS